MQVRVGELIRKLSEFSPELPVRIDFDTEYDGMPVTRSGPADDCVVLHDGEVIITGTDRNMV